MAKSTTRATQHLGGKKGTILAERLQSVDLEKVLIVPIEIGKSDNKACIADYFGAILKAPFAFPSGSFRKRSFFWYYDFVYKSVRMTESV